MKVILFNELHEVKIINQKMRFEDNVILNVHELLALGGQIVDVFYLHVAQCPAGIQKGSEHISLEELSNAEIKALLPGIDLRKKGQKIACPEGIELADYNEPTQVEMSEEERLEYLYDYRHVCDSHELQAVISEIKELESKLNPPNNINSDRAEVLEIAYLNACDCLYYGYGSKYWNSLDLDDNEKKQVWEKAKNTLSNENRY